MWRIDKAEQYKGNFGYVYLTRLNDEGEELSEKMMLPIMVLDNYDWDNPVAQLSDDVVSVFLNDIIDTLQLFEDEIPGVPYSTHIVEAEDELTDEDDCYFAGGLPEENICYVKTGMRNQF